MDWEKMGISRYRTAYDSNTKTFRILDTWHQSIKNIPENELDKDIPDDSPALKILTAEEINSLLEALKEQGWLDKYINIEQIQPKIIERSKSLQEIAVEKIADIAKSDFAVCDQKVSSEAVLAIREIITRI